MNTAQKVLAVLVGLWASYGVLLLIRAVSAFANGTLQTLPNVVQDVIVMLFINLGIPCIALFLLLRQKKQPWDKSK
jgi:hypothetical protein